MPPTRRRIAGEPKRRNPLAIEPRPDASAILAWMEMLEKVADDGGEAIAHYSQAIHRGILRTGFLPGGVDKRLAAGRIRRPMLKGAQALHAASVAFYTARTNWLAQFGEPRKLTGNGAGINFQA